MEGCKDMITDVYIEQIKDNYWYGAYGPFKVVMMKDTSFINDTKLCLDGGKLFYYWKSNKTSQTLYRPLKIC